MDWVTAAFGGGAILCAAAAGLSKDFRGSAIGIWGAGILLGVYLLTSGAEFLALVLWILSTLSAVGFVFFSLVMGEFGKKPSEEPVIRQSRRRALIPLLGVFAAGTVFIGLASSGFVPEAGVSKFEPMALLGVRLVEEHMVTVIAVCFLSFVVLVCAGVVARETGSEAE